MKQQTNQSINQSFNQSIMRECN